MSRDLPTCTVCGEEEGGDEYGCEQAIECQHCNGSDIRSRECIDIEHVDGYIFPHDFEYKDGCNHGCVCSDPNEDY